MVQQFCHRHDRVGIFHQLDGRDGEQNVGFLLVERDRHLMFVFQPFDALAQFFGRHAKRAAVIARIVGAASSRSLGPRPAATKAWRAPPTIEAMSIAIGQTIVQRPHIVQVSNRSFPIP